MVGESISLKEGDLIEIDLSHVPLRPSSKKEIMELETALIIGTIYRPEVLQLILDPVEKATWVDSLAVAAGALAREKAGYPISKIAEELGRSESTVRNHLKGKTKAGKLVRETYELLARGELKLVIPIKGVLVTQDKIKELEERVKELEKENAELKEKLQQTETQEKVEELMKRIESLQKELEEKERILSEIRKLVCTTIHS
ncbi:transcriptional regulator [Ignicoccus islandicus DSM 13165]|uniref:Transcriptional regulator n=1 Tax=Ignicoccus islandicus DSM 13165 TaxID=940295 RepID=A0A0U3FIK9_9CREN|nr:helix-turn-helix domain-containing protein [Ignicoccus islandicus]ALU11734.1 transcriptional regulator [Ignicoccus islandicus DSM 13165]